MRVVCHLNIVGFRAAVAAAVDKTLRGRPYVIAGGTGGRTIVWDLSPQAIEARIKPGMALAAAERLVPDLRVLAPDPGAYRKVNAALETIAARYAPVYQNDQGGNLYLDLTGTARLFGPPVDCMCRVLNEVSEGLGLETAAATAANKLVSKVASRTIRPYGFSLRTLLRLFLYLNRTIVSKNNLKDFKSRVSLILFINCSK